MQLERFAWTFVLTANSNTLHLPETFEIVYECDLTSTDDILF